ncbi:MAG: hypothetical protein HKN56_00765 [Gammaproteobacteria bacterium]|nr:hypothetical protein [Gammaproteobacteria bacterium]
MAGKRSLCSQPGNGTDVHRLILILCLTAVVTPVLSRAAAIDGPPAEADEFHFVVLGDAQFHQPATFNRLIDQVRRLRPAFVIQVGDMIEGYNSDLDTVEQEWDRFAKQIQPLEPITYYPVPGNHDVYGDAKVPDRALEQLYAEKFGPLYFQFSYKNALFLGLNTDSSEGANAISGAQFDWLKKTLRENRQPHVFVFMHRPPNFLQNAEALHTLFKTHKVAHVFYGHHHHYHFREQDGVKYSMTNAAANSVNEHPDIGGFRHLLQVSVRGDEVNTAVIEADAIKPQDIVAPGDNYDFFALDQRLLPDSVALQKTGDAFKFAIELNNVSARNVQVFVSCTSADDRWQIEPAARPAFEVTRKTKQRLTYRASYAANRQPESMPECVFRVPFQTERGKWLDFTKTVNTTR